MKKKGFLLVILLSCALGVILPNLIKPVDPHERYGSYLRNHPFSKAPLEEDLSEGPRPDRPDLAFRQNFIMTMDPQLKRPAPERLARALAVAERRTSAFKGQSPDLIWEERGPLEVAGRTRAIMWDPNDPAGTKVWAGGVTGGLWFNDDIGNSFSTWQIVDDYWNSLSVSAIDHDPTDPNTFYVGTGEGFGSLSSTLGDGIWKSSDGGASFQPLPASKDMKTIYDLVVRNENGQGVLYVAVGDPGYQNYNDSLARPKGLYRSTDGGQSFNQVLPQINNQSDNYAPIDLEIAANNRLWVGTIDGSAGGGGEALYSDDGLNFNVALNTQGDRVELAVAPSDSNFVYALIERYGRIFQMRRSVDQGLSWQSMTLPDDADPGIPASDFTRGQGWYDLIAQVDPNDASVISVGGIDIFRSRDTGNTWQQMTHWFGGFGYPYAHADQHQIVYKPGSSSEILFGHDGGITLSKNYTNNLPLFSTRNRGYNVTQFYSGALHPDFGEEYFLGGTQDNGTQQFTRQGLGNTNRATGGDGGYCFIDEDNPDFQITSYVYNVFHRSFNGGRSFNNRFIDEFGTGRFINPADYDDQNDVLYAARDYLTIYRFRNVRGILEQETIRLRNMFDLASAFEVSPYSNTSTLFVGSGAGKIYRIDSASASDANDRVTELTPLNFPTGYISCIQTGRNEDELLVTFSNYGVSSIWYTNDGGQTWQEKEGDLPDMPVRWALFNPKDYNMAIVATELGVWMCKDLNALTPQWNPVNTGLANVRVDMLDLRASDQVVLAATHGRGMFTSRFESGLSSDRESLQAAKFQVYPNPARENLNIESPAGQKNWQGKIYDLQGKVRSELTPQEQGRWQVNVADWPAAYYLLRMERGEEVFETRFMVRD